MKTIAAPHANPRKPAFTMPLGACDAHCHVFGPALRFPYVPARCYTPPDAPAAQLAALHRRLGIARAVLVQASVHGSDNRAMLDAIAGDPPNHRGVAMVEAFITHAELQRLHASGIRAVRFNFVRHLGGAPNLQTVSKVAQCIAEFGWHLVLHLDAQDLQTYRSFLDSLPVPFVIDHMGRVPVGQGIDQPAFRMLLELMRDPRAWVKLSGAERISATLTPYLDTVPFAARLIAAAPDRVLWGTDWPHPNVREMPDDGVLVDLLPRFTSDPVALHRLLVDNPSRLYWND